MLDESPTARRVVGYALLTAALVAAATLVSLVLHEVGHWAMAALLGGRLGGIHLYWPGGGSASVSAGPPLSPSDTAMRLAGLAVDAVVGVASLLVARRSRRPPFALAALVLGGVSLLHASVYVIRGLYYGSADPDALPWAVLSREAYETYWSAPWRAYAWWGSAVVVFCVVAWVVARAFLRWQAGTFGARAWAARVGLAAALMSPSALLACVAVCTASPRSPEPFQSPETRVGGAKSAALLREIRAKSPELTDAEAWRLMAEQVKRTPWPRPRADELPPRLEFWYLATLALAAGVLASLATPRSAQGYRERGRGAY